MLDLGSNHRHKVIYAMQGIELRLAGGKFSYFEGAGSTTMQCVCLCFCYIVGLRDTETAIFVASKMAATIWKVTEKHKQKHALHCG
jgi:hypothetical protein